MPQEIQEIMFFICNCKIQVYPDKIQQTLNFRRDRTQEASYFTMQLGEKVVPQNNIQDFQGRWKE